MLNWITDKDIRPEDGQEVLAVIDGCVRTAKFEYDEFHYNLDWIKGAEYLAYSIDLYSDRLTAWCTLPAAPEFE